MNHTRRWLLISGLVVAVALVLRATDVLDIPAYASSLIAVGVFLLVGLVVGDYTAEKRRKRRDARRAESMAWSPTDDRH